MYSYGDYFDFMPTIKKRLQVIIPPFYMKRLVAWAFCKKQTKTSLAQNILQARIEANDDLIKKMVAEQATDWGVSEADAWERILAEMGYDPKE